MSIDAKAGYAVAEEALAGRNMTGRWELASSFATTRCADRKSVIPRSPGMNHR